MTSDLELAVDTVDGAMDVFVSAPPDAAEAPLVVVYPDGPGVRDDLYDFARRLAAAGYVAVLPDLFYRYGPEGVVDIEKMAREDPGELAHVLRMIDGLVDETILRETRDVVRGVDAQGVARPGPRGCIGLCVGARFMLRAMAAFPDTFAAGAGLHPSFVIDDTEGSPHLDVRRIRGSLYFAHGDADRVMPPERLQPLWDEVAARTRGGVIDRLEGVGHAFMFPRLPYYAHEAAERTWRRVIDHLGRELGPASTTKES